MRRSLTKRKMFQQNKKKHKSESKMDGPGGVYHNQVKEAINENKESSNNYAHIKEVSISGTAKVKNIREATTLGNAVRFKSRKKGSI